MCGIAGISVKDNLTFRDIQDFKSLLILSEDRGREATGYAFNSSRGLYYQKAPIPASIFAETVSPRVSRAKWANWIIGHTRRSSGSSPQNNDNNHPILSGRTLGIHNGRVHDVDYLSRKYRLERKAEVDSELIFALVDKYGWKGLEKLYGSFAVAYANSAAPGILFLAKGVSPLWLATTSRALYFASNRTYLEAIGLKRTFTLKRGTWLKVKDGRIVKKRRLKLKSYTVSSEDQRYVAPQTQLGYPSLDSVHPSRFRPYLLHQQLHFDGNGIYAGRE